MLVSYTVTIGSESQSFPTREEAVSAAKEQSRQHRGEVMVQDAAGAETLTYRNGELMSYLWDDRK